MPNALLEIKILGGRIFMELPQEFIKKMESLLGKDADKFFDSLNNPSKKAITVNHQRISSDTFEKLADFEHKKIDGVENGYFTEGLKFEKHILNHLGCIYSQEPSAMLPVELMGIENGDYVLDVCSAPGGKSIQILEKLCNTGFLVSNEIVYSRAKILYENLTRMGFKNFAITCNSPEDYAKTDIVFDKILVDAPCGGEGMIRKGGFDLNAFKLSNIETNAKRQLSILNSIKHLLKDGGTLVYSTCTYDTKENEEVVATFLKENPNYSLVAPNDKFFKLATSGIKIGDTPTDLTLRRYPHQFEGEGQFMAIFKKSGTQAPKEDSFDADNFAPVFRKDMTDISRETKGVIDLSELNLYKRGDSIFVCPDVYINFKNLNLLTLGTVLGNLTKGVLKINHNFYHTYPERFFTKVDLDDTQVIKYLHGEEVDIDKDLKGIAVITYSGIALGGGKCVNGRLKNYYPKELRI